MSDMDMGHSAPETPRDGASRRSFIKGVIAAGAAVSSSAYLFRTNIAGQPASGGGERLISITVNGQVRRVDVLKQETLATTLRYKLGLTGTKLGCDRAECGACTVLMDGRRMKACLSFAALVEGREITTIEGLDPEGALTDVQRAFVDCGAVQCGFCTPGLVVAVHDLLDRVPDPDELTVREALAGNLCRCTGYGRIVEAVHTVVARRDGAR